MVDDITHELFGGPTGGEIGQVTGGKGLQMGAGKRHALRNVQQRPRALAHPVVVPTLRLQRPLFGVAIEGQAVAQGVDQMQFKAPQGNFFRHRGEIGDLQGVEGLLVDGKQVFVGDLAGQQANQQLVHIPSAPQTRRHKAPCGAMSLDVAQGQQLAAPAKTQQ